MSQAKKVIENTDIQAAFDKNNKTKTNVLASKGG